MSTKSRQRKERLPELPAVLTLAVIDDDPSARLLLGHSLTELGHQVLEFADAEEFLRQWEGEEIEPDLIFLDHLLPGTSGLELSRRLNDTMLPIVMVTSMTDAAVLEQMAAVSSWVLNYIAKPVSQQAVVGRLSFIRGQIRRQRADEEAKKRALQNVEDSRDVNRAVAVICRREKCDPITAYNFLSARSNKTGIKIPLLAQQFINSASDDELKSADKQVASLSAHKTDESGKANQDERG